MFLHVYLWKVVLNGHKGYHSRMLLILWPPKMVQKIIQTLKTIESEPFCSCFSFFAFIKTKKEHEQKNKQTDS